MTAKRTLTLALSALALAALAAAQEKVVIQYDCIPNYANWGGVTALYRQVAGVTVPPDPKGSSVAMAALEKEKEAPQADTVYYSGAIGFQAAGTRGRNLLDGAKSIRIKGRDVGVAATIEHLDSMSAHADSNEILRWLSGFTSPPHMTYLVHGEPTALSALKTRIDNEIGWPVRIAEYQQRVEV